VSLLDLQRRLTYGPIDSRRLGRSLGINILPFDRKVCTFDCCYCQYGSTKDRGDSFEGFPTLDEIVRAVESALWQSPTLDAITFSGNGEPTIHPDFPAIVRKVRFLRDKLASSVPLVLLSNSSILSDERVREAVSLLDMRIMKLEVGSQRTLGKMNRPRRSITFDEIVSGLSDTPNVIIQALFVKGSVDNRTDPLLEEWIDALLKVKPLEVQVYSLDRPVPDEELEQVSMQELEDIAERVRSKLHVKAKAYGR
jgi:wyosine [tRNA(Phe)-imidazoG37] synthetase (radical SAM superfamily)